MSASDDAELNRRLAQRSDTPEAVNLHNTLVSAPGIAPAPLGDTRSHCQWTSDDGTRFFPAAKTYTNLRPGLYDVSVHPALGVYLQWLPVKTDGLIEFPHTNSQKVVGEIQAFWERGDIFESFSLIHKRGIMLWGPPGSGKSSTIQLILKDVVERGGVAVKYNDPTLFTVGMRLLREVQPLTPVVVLMEDIDYHIKNGNETMLLNILDGVERIEHTVFLASTNYPELLGPRILNRPSRFDKRFKIGHPTAESREIYFKHLIGERKLPAVDVDRWVRDTQGMSIAHLKELFVAVVILGDEYKDAVKTLQSMKEAITSESERARMGLVKTGTDGYEADRYEE